MKTLLLVINSIFAINILLLLSFGQVQAYMNEQELTYTYRGIEYDCVFFSKHAKPPILRDDRNHFGCGKWEHSPFDSVFQDTLRFTGIFYVVDDVVFYYDFD
jgi:hypothetical protein